jgi:zinc finger protein
MVVAYKPHPFHWVPADGRRHASADERPGNTYADGTEVGTLCGRQLVADNSTVAWFWETCPDCDVRAHALAGVPMAGIR